VLINIDTCTVIYIQKLRVIEFIYIYILYGFAMGVELVSAVL
jgi:hypothetical protein